MELWELTARENIRDIVARYNSLGDSGHIAAMMCFFTPDAVLDVIGAESIRGREAIEVFFLSVAQQSQEKFQLKYLHHHTSTHQIDLVDEASAKGRSYFAVLTQDGLDHWGRYVDEYRCHNQDWQIHHRKVYVDGVTPGGWGDMRSR